MLPLLLLCAPAPFLRPAVAEAVLAAPGLEPPALLAPPFVARALSMPGAPKVAPEWVRERLRAVRHPQGIRLTMERCGEGEGVAVLEALADRHLADRIGKKGSRENELIARELPKMPPKHRKLVLEYFRKLRRTEMADLIPVAPRSLR
ncbi:MAG: hypothetical protein K2W96_08775 [Gemmataceae bacterium]|nr:hypothetical protein [Gemmataceae bacterium]